MKGMKGMEKCHGDMFLSGEKCQYPEGMTVSPDGTNELDPCIYEDTEIHTNCTVIVSKCRRCGHVTLSWMRTDETEDIMLEDGEEPQ